MSLVVLDDVTLFFGERLIFDSISLRLGHGDRVGLIGPNGSGKTTLLKIIAGDQEIDDGKVTRANGVRVGWLPQDISDRGWQDADRHDPGVGAGQEGARYSARRDRRGAVERQPR